MIFIIWAAGGQTRPYKAPVSLKKGEREFAYYIRKGSVTIRARHQDETELMSLAATVPFDDRLKSGVESEMAILILNDLLDVLYLCQSHQTWYRGYARSIGGRIRHAQITEAVQT